QSRHLNAPVGPVRCAAQAKNAGIAIFPIARRQLQSSLIPPGLFANPRSDFPWSHITIMSQGRISTADVCQLSHERAERLALTGRSQRPVHPGQFVILAISVVVALLRSATFIAHLNHWSAQ